jgi:hypothetical protein
VIAEATAGAAVIARAAVVVAIAVVATAANTLADTAATGPTDTTHKYRIVKMIITRRNHARR